MKKVLKVVAIFVILGSIIIAISGCQIAKKADQNLVEENVSFIDKKDSYYISINGTKYYAGDKIASLANSGYVIREVEASQTVPAKKYMIGAGSMKNTNAKTVFNVTPYNPSESDVSVADSVIGGVSIDSYDAKNAEEIVNFEVYGGVTLNSTLEDVKKVFGEPSSVVGTDKKTYKYESEEIYRSYSFTFDEDGKMTNIRWQNLILD